MIFPEAINVLVFKGEGFSGDSHESVIINAITILECSAILLPQLLFTVIFVKRFVILGVLIYWESLAERSKHKSLL